MVVPGGGVAGLRRADVSSSLITTEGRFTRRKRSLSGDERGETSAVRRPGGGRGDILYNGLYGEASAPPERGTFIKLQVYERVEILLVEVFKRGGKSVILVCERDPKGLTDEFSGFIKSIKNLFL